MGGGEEEAKAEQRRGIDMILPHTCSMSGLKQAYDIVSHTQMGRQQPHLYTVNPKAHIANRTARGGDTSV